MIKSEVCFSNLNLPPVKAATIGAEELRELLHKTGYDDAEIAPTRWLMQDIGRLARKDAFKNTDQDQRLIGSVHQPPSRGIPRALRSGSLDNIKAALVMPEEYDALEAMTTLQKLADAAIPAVLYPNYKIKGELVVFDDKNAPFKQRLTQIYPEFYSDCGVWSGREIGDEGSLRSSLERSGLTGVCVDGFHVRRKGKRARLRGLRLDWEGVLEDITRMHIRVPEFHFAIGRLDSSEWDAEMQKTTMDEYEAARKGPEAISRTEIGDILLQTLALHTAQTMGQQAFRVVVELPGPTVGRADFVKVHQEIAAHLGQFLGR